MFDFLLVLRKRCLRAKAETRKTRESFKEKRNIACPRPCVHLLPEYSRKRSTTLPKSIRTLYESSLLNPFSVPPVSSSFSQTRRNTIEDESDWWLPPADEATRRVRYIGFTETDVTNSIRILQPRPSSLRPFSISPLKFAETLQREGDRQFEGWKKKRKLRLSSDLMRVFEELERLSHTRYASNPTRELTGIVRKSEVRRRMNEMGLDIGSSRQSSSGTLPTLKPPFDNSLSALKTSSVVDEEQERRSRKRRRESKQSMGPRDVDWSSDREGRRRSIGTETISNTTSSSESGTLDGNTSSLRRSHRLPDLASVLDPYADITPLRPHTRALRPRSRHHSMHLIQEVSRRGENEEEQFWTRESRASKSDELWIVVPSYSVKPVTTSPPRILADTHCLDKQACSIRVVEGPNFCGNCGVVNHGDGDDDEDSENVHKLSKVAGPRKKTGLVDITNTYAQREERERKKRAMQAEMDGIVKNRWNHLNRRIGRIG